MYATREGNRINVSPDLAMALAGQIHGYRIELHAMPGVVWHVEGDNADRCIEMCVSICKREGRPVSTNAATFKRVEA